MTASTRRLDQPLGGGAGLVGDLGAGQHAGDLLAAALGGELGDAGRDALALVERVLADEVMPVGARRHLRRVRHRQHLHAAREPREPHADRVGHRAADAGVDLVEHQRRRRAAVGQHDLERQQEARQLAAGGDLHQRPRPRAGIGLHPELDAVDAVRPGAAASLSISVENCARSSLSGLSSALTALSSAAARLRRAPSTARSAALR